MAANSGALDRAFGRALQAVREGADQEALRLLDRLGREWPKVPPVHYLKSEVLQRTGRPEAAAQALMRALQLEYGLPAATDVHAFWQVLVAGAGGEAPVQHLRHRSREIASFARLLERTGVLRDAGRASLDALSGLDPACFESHERTGRLALLMDLCAFSKASDPSWNRVLFGQVLKPWLERLLGSGSVDDALVLESVLLREYVGQTETEEHFRNTVAEWKAPMLAAARAFGSRLPSLRPSPAGAPPRVVFFVHKLSRLAHVRLLVDALEGHAALDRPLIEPVIACLEPSRNPDVIARLQALGIEAVMLDPEGRVGTAALLRLREEVARRDAAAVVWVSLASSLMFAFGMRVAPVQIWWAMKYHGLAFEEIDGYLTAGGIAGGTREIGGRAWRAGPIAAEDWYLPGAEGRAREVRSSFPSYRILFGSFGREEKLNGADFLGAVAAVLREVPDAGFLWTGRIRHPGIQARFEAEGVAERCHFIGWVDTRLYAQVIDVFLDSFPFPCGYTLYESMAAGKPAVLYASPEAAETGALSMIGPLLAGVAGEEERLAASALFGLEGGDPLHLAAPEPAAYVRHAVRLARDEAFRRRAGDAFRGFVARYMSDRRRLGQIYFRHIVDIIREKGPA